MRTKSLLLVVFLAFGLSCSSITNMGEVWDMSPDYSLTTLDGSALPGPASSLPGLLIWEGEDGTQLTVWRGQVSCNEDGSGAENFGFRLSSKGSAIWDPIVVSIDLTCESAGGNQITFRNVDTGEVLHGTLQEGFEGCPVLAKALPSVQSLRAGYVSSGSGASFPAELEFSGALNGEYREHSCSGM